MSTPHIYLRGEKKHSTMVANVGYIDTEQIQQIFGTYLTASPYEKRGVFTGTFYLIRESADIYADSPPGNYDFNHQIYQYYEEKGLIKNLERKYRKTGIK